MERRPRVAGLALVTGGVATMLLVHWMVAFWVPTEASQGVVQRIFYVHVPAAWTTFLAFGIVALASAAYLWLEDERADAAAVAAAEGGLIFGAIMLISGPLWGRIAWGTYWTWEPRLTLTLLLWFTYLGYFLIRGSVADPRRGKRFAAVVAVIGSLNIPLIHVSVSWFRSLHPGPVVIKPEGPTLHPDMLATLLTSLAGFTLLFLGLFSFRYAVERLGRRSLPGGAAGPMED
ncbi:MAG: cytochrome c biogenesis protein CcsA [Gemmatimonadetes bacterium]|nr:cytochrome c biogenesis protein CcsA [Gemmatimonadota bacterium]